MLLSLPNKCGRHILDHSLLMRAENRVSFANVKTEVIRECATFFPLHIQEQP